MGGGGGGGAEDHDPPPPPPKKKKPTLVPHNYCFIHVFDPLFDLHTLMLQRRSGEEISVIYHLLKYQICIYIFIFKNCAPHY